MIAKVVEENGVKSLVSLSGNTVNTAERFPDWAHPKTITVNPWTADEDCYVEGVSVSTGGGAHMDIDGKVASVRDDAGGVYVTTLNGFIKKGQVLNATQTMPDRCKVFPLLPTSAPAPVEDDVYSTTETMTNKVWIDGKRIYRIVVTDEVTVQSSEETNIGDSTTQSLLASLNIAQITYAAWVRTGDGVYVPIQARYYEGAYKKRGFDAWSGSSGKTILEYTKA
jgi:hypothetical protein